MASPLQTLEPRGIPGFGWSGLVTYVNCTLSSNSAGPECCAKRHFSLPDHGCYPWRQAFTRLEVGLSSLFSRVKGETALKAAGMVEELLFVQ